MKIKCNLFSARLSRLVGLAFLVSLNCAVISIASAQSPSPPPVPPDGSPTAAIIFPDGTWVIEVSGHGIFPPVATLPAQRLNIELRFPLMLANRLVIVQVLDGGTLYGPSALTIGSDGRVSIQFQTANDPGEYRVLLIAGGTLTELQFEASAPPILQAHLGNISTRGYVQAGDDVMIGGIYNYWNWTKEGDRAGTWSEPGQSWNYECAAKSDARAARSHRCGHRVQ